VPKILALVFSVVLVVAACSAGPDAPAVHRGEVACADRFCVGFPDGWDVETGEEYLSFVHPEAPERAFATVAFVNTEGVVTAAGGTWPATSETLVRSFWTLLEDQGVASFERMERVGDGRIVASGSYQGGRLWTLFIPIDSRRALGVEVRGPNPTWEPHAEMFFDQVIITP
jgi:hypothetical protein